ncbi:hypothetical protein FISHEDRAFT_68783 [Fistulina hepatica ATCC 64428]|uniref:Uncharacterized protein n=1 Tax=Fistulina hepatica ATCC 64428 TaxID=1128425 RepID=A0A0D7APR0_9AGAR|nr:hypothetical protein FISHEDRAFT_68783 [Fistulina hepatica ATCC 64428]
MSKQTEVELDTLANCFMDGRLWGRSDTTTLNEADVLLLFWRIIPQEQRPDSRDDVQVGLLGQQTDLVDLLRNAWKSGKSYKAIRRHSAYIQAFPPSDSIPQQAQPSVHRKEMVRSWTRPYTGNAPDALWKHIEDHIVVWASYAPYCSIVQSSGTGKSRCIDEFSKTHFVIPINLRDPLVTGFPAADAALHGLFTPRSIHGYSSGQIYTLMEVFLIALFEEVEKVIAKHASNSEDLPSWFRQYMTEGQTFESQGQKRKSLYEAVAKRTRSLLYNDLKAEGPNNPLKNAAVKLLKHFKSHKPDNSSHPRVILAFDEAHTLTRGVEESENPDVSRLFSPFSHLRRCLRAIRFERMFSVFLSTTGKITEFSDGNYQPTKFELSTAHSTRVASGRTLLVPTFTALGWDNLAPPLPASAISEGVSCKNIGFDYQVFLGRPVFGTLYLSMLETRKLLKSLLCASDEYDDLNAFMRCVGETLTGCTGIAELTPAAKFAVLSQRFPLEFKVYSVAEREQVERHLRVCVSVDESFVSMVTTNSSEPILSEAACFYMRQADFNAPDTLLEIMRGFSIDKGDCGELIVLLLLTLARDEAEGLWYPYRGN